MMTVLRAVVPSQLEATDTRRSKRETVNARSTLRLEHLDKEATDGPCAEHEGRLALLEAAAADGVRGDGERLAHGGDPERDVVRYAVQVRRWREEVLAQAAAEARDADEPELRAGVVAPALAGVALLAADDGLAAGGQGSSVSL